MDVGTVVIGAGPAGLAASYHLGRHRLDHLVLERGRIGETWRAQRWRSFTLNTPGWMNALPDGTQPGRSPTGFATHDALVQALEDHVRRLGLPVRTGVDVVAVERAGDDYLVRTSDFPILTGNVVVASGAQNVPVVPELGARLPAWIDQLHVADYIAPDILKPGSVLVVGGGQSGVQIAEELAESGRRTYLSTSRVGRMPRRYRGQDIAEWLRDTGHYDRDTTNDDAPRPPQAQISGGRGGHTLSYQQLAREGVVLLGRLEGVEGSRLLLAGDLVENVRFADSESTRIKTAIDAHIRRAGISAPAPEDDAAEAQEERLEAARPARQLDLALAGIRTVIWATGFTGNFSWLPGSLLGRDGSPRHDRGAMASPGLFIVGLPWLSTRKSGILHGMGEDAARVASLIAERVRARTPARAA